MAITLPLDPAATSAADDAFYAKYPEMIDENGQRIPLDPDNPDHDAMCADWCDIYEAELHADPAPDDPAEGGDGDEDDGGGNDGGGDDGGDDDVPGEERPPDDDCQECEEEEEEELPEEPTVRIRVSLFFDGTGNNRANERSKDSTEGGFDGIADGESNISKMEECAREDQPDYDHYRPIYVEGIGTRDGRWDNPVDSGTGMGFDGVKEKVEKGIEALLAAVDGFAVGGKPVDRFTIDAFGFSRGAAAARYFIWRMLKEPGQTLDDRLAGKLNMQCKVDAKFLGLYDTVSSFGLDHEDDVTELKLDKIYDTQTIVQLAAAEEHRLNFQLTTVRSGTEIYLPGVHSDVGGGYPSFSDEVDWQLVDIDVAWQGDAERDMFDRETSWILERGWATESELQEVDFWNQLKWTRRGLTNYYSRIPLQLMREHAEPAGIPFFASMMDDGRCTIATIPDPDHKRVLEVADTEIRKVIGTGKCASASHWLNNVDDQWHKDLRNKHLHQSARYGETAYAHEPDWTTGDPVTGTRKRNTNAG